MCNQCKEFRKIAANANAEASELRGQLAGTRQTELELEEALAQLNYMNTKAINAGFESALEAISEISARR